MTRRSLRFALAGVPVLLAAGIAAACGPYAPAGCSMPPASSGTTQSCPSAMPQAPACPVQATLPSVPSAVSVWTLSVVGGKLQLQTADGARSQCERMTMVVNGADPIEVLTKGSKIHLAAGKDSVGACSLQAVADRVTRTGWEGSLVTLEGNATLVYVRNGKKADIAADRIAVNLPTGQVTVDMDVPQPVATPPAPVLTPPSIQNTTYGPITLPR